MTDEVELPAHELIIQTSPPMTFDRGARTSHGEDLLVACPCGWKWMKASTTREARRAFDRHLARVAVGRVDLSSGAQPDQPDRRGSTSDVT